MPGPATLRTTVGACTRSTWSLAVAAILATATLVAACGGTPSGAPGPVSTGPATAGSDAAGTPDGSVASVTSVPSSNAGVEVVGPTPVPTTGQIPAAFRPGHLKLTLSRIAGTYTMPVLVTNAHDGSGRLFVVEQGGTIRIYSAGKVLATAFLDIHTKVSCCGERGLLGLAFHPSYKTNGRFFVDYTNTNGDTVIAEYHRSSTNSARARTTGTVLLTIAQPYANHNGGMLAFGRDGYLYIAMGDGGSGGDPQNRAQNKSSLLGKILRIDVNHHTSTRHYTAPKTNPFVGKAGDDRIWAYGLRNPWRFSFDRSTGDLWIGDVGQDRYEEVDRATHASGGGRGLNYGWHVVEGNTCFNPSSGCSKTGKTHPITTYSHGANGCAVVGGYVYRGTRYSAMTGAYIFGDYCSGRIWALTANGAATQKPSLLLSSGLMISSFGEAEDGTMYLTDIAGGHVYRLIGASK